MKKLFPIFIFICASLFSQAQSYQYIPLDLDTSSFWIQKYHYYSGNSGSPIQINGEVVQYVEKDTIINTKTYHKVRGYNTTYIPLMGSLAFNTAADKYNCYNPIIYLYDDTVNQKVLSWYPSNDVSLLNYNLSIGDSLNYLPPSTSTYAKFPVDSTSIKTYFGVSRKTMFGTMTFGNTLYWTIEGVGASVNFPDVGSGEWGTPLFSLSAYLKNDTVLYKDQNFSSDSCYKKQRGNSACAPLSISEKEVIRSLVTYSNNKLNIERVNMQLDISLISMHGNVLLKERSIGRYSKDLSYFPAGIYILSIQSPNGIDNRKILIR